METLKKIINIIVMLYLVVAALIYLDILNIGQSNEGFYTAFFVIGGIIMLLELIIENLYAMSLKRGYTQYQHKINELKANLYDQKQELQDIKNRQPEIIPARLENRSEINLEPATQTSNSFQEPITAPVGTPPEPVTEKPLPADNLFPKETRNGNAIIIPTPPDRDATDRRFPNNPESPRTNDRNF